MTTRENQAQQALAHFGYGIEKGRDGSYQIFADYTVKAKQIFGGGNAANIDDLEKWLDEYVDLAYLGEAAWRSLAS